MSISIGPVTVDVAFADLLKCFWTDWLDSPCHCCQEPFSDKPPIRTFAAAKEETHSTHDIHIRIFNRHLSCLKQSQACYIPVSHVWEPAIRDAHTLRLPTFDANLAIYSAIKALLSSSSGVFSQNVELWHDYYSVPQWNETIQKSLLLNLPMIYHGADEILVQLSDIGPYVIQTLFDAALNQDDLSSYKKDMSLYLRLQLITPVRSLCASQWTTRLWTTMEYSVSRRASIMDQSNRIWRTYEGKHETSRNTLGDLLSCCSTALVGISNSAHNLTAKIFKVVNTLSDLVPEQGSMENTCLGEALELIAHKQCQYFHDRFIALNIILNCNALPGSTGIPTNNIDACMSVFGGAMERGDPSPLLLQPRESILDSNPGPGTPSWLVGCHSFDAVAWDMGRQEELPGLRITVNRGLVETELIFAGVIEEIQQFDVEKCGTLAGIDWTIELLLRMAHGDGTVLSAKNLVDGLYRVFPLEHFYSTAIPKPHDVAFSYEDLQNRDMRFAKKIEKLLAIYVNAPKGGPGASLREAVALEISRMLMLKQQTKGSKTSITRLVSSCTIAMRHRDRGVVRGESICRVRCPNCSVRSLLRLDLRDNATAGAKVFWIPELTYSKTVEGGVGIVLHERRIVGRMLHGTTYCGCRLPERVRIE